MTKPLWQWSACDLAAAIRTKEVSCVEVTEAAVTRMRAANPPLNAVTVDLGDEAIETAKKADQIAATEVALGPLHGVPITIKENVDVKGQATPNGVKAFENLIAPDDSPITRHLKEAGAIIIGRTNTPEFSFRAFTDNPLRGLTKNPWNEGITCGGSSGGAGASLAAGIGAIAHGNDIGGSLRIPAYCNGVVTIKPTLGRVPAYNPSAPEERPPLMQIMSVQGPITREVRDARLSLAVMAQGDAHDPWWVPAPLDGPRPAEPIRIAKTTNAFGIPMHNAVVEAIDTAAKHLEDAGYAIEEVDPPNVIEVFELWRDLIFTEMHVMMGKIIEEYAGDDMKKVVAAYYKWANVRDFEGYMRGLADRTRLLRQWTEFLEHYPLVLCPASLQPPFPVNADLASEEAPKQVFEALTYISSMNLMGLPASIVPVLINDSLPIGVQIIGGRYREDLCLDAAQAIEVRAGILVEQLWARG